MSLTGKKRAGSDTYEDTGEPAPKYHRTLVTNYSAIKNHGSYSVGWICALSKEQTAATAMLDERHPDLPKPPHDSNTYTLGSIGKHNIVIACLPDGKYGSNAAADVVALMAGTFPSVRSCLLVGIGGGIPSNDVRLGDVVVGRPEAQHPGVVQWDMGKSKQGGIFERTGALDNPPKAFLTALTKLKTEHELFGSKIQTILEDLKSKYPRAAERYLRSDSLMDTLFRADYDHVNSPKPPADAHRNGQGSEQEDESFEEDDDENDDNEEVCRFCDLSKVKKRKPREMKVHYGLIASGNQVIKDAKFRDRLNNELGRQLLCVEMEAAGIANNLPCFVIRGICDYADSHKNKIWQEHAAAVAAAYAKELLCVVQPSEVQGERLLIEVLDECKNLHKHIEHVNQAVQSGFQNAQINFSSLVGDKEAQRTKTILNWLSDIDFTHQQSDYICMHEPGTGQRLLRSAEFLTWIENKDKTLFCPGIPGAGKTIQASIIIDHLLDRFGSDAKIGVAYQYYSFQRHQNQRCELLVANLIKQLAQHLDPFPNSVELLHKQHNEKGKRPSLQQLFETLQTVVSSYSRVFIVLDALDEFEDDNQGRSKFLGGLFNIQKNFDLNLLATSRFVQEIEKRFAGHMKVVVRPSKSDVFKFLDQHMGQLPNFVQDDADLREEVKTGIENAIEGIFLLARLYLDSLVGKRSVAAIRKVLRDLKNASSISQDGRSALDDAYEKAMGRIQRQNGDLASDAMTILSWILNCRRQLKVAELQEALAVENDKSELDPDNIPDIEHMTRACAGLVVIDEESGIIRLVHYTTQEYLQRVQKHWFRCSQAGIVGTLIAYLSFPAVQANINVVPGERNKTHPLSRYAIENWGHHTREALVEGMEPQTVIAFLESRQNIEVVNCVMSEAKFEFTNEADHFTAMHVAGFFGMSDVIKALLEKGYQACAQDENDDTTPLWWAARMGHPSSVKLLIQGGADVNVQDSWSLQTPLHWASKMNHALVVKLLLETGANIEAQDVDGATALIVAAEGGHGTVVKLLLESGALPDLKESPATSNGATSALCKALQNTHDDIAKLLLLHGASTEVRSDEGLTPLAHAVRAGNYALTEALLNCNVDIDAVFGERGDTTALSLAASNGHEAILSLLLGHGANVNMDGVKLLESSLFRGNKAIIKELLRAGAKFGDPIADLATVVLKEADTNLVAKYGENSLSHLIRILSSLDQLDQWNKFDQQLGQWHQLYQFHQWGQPQLWHILERILELIIAWGEVEIDRKDESGRTPLSYAAEQNLNDFFRFPIGRRLVESNRVDLNSRDLDGRTPLSHCKTWAMTELLIDTGAVDIDAKDNFGRTPISHAAGQGLWEVVGTLFNGSADRMLEDNRGRRPHWWTMRYAEVHGNSCDSDYASWLEKLQYKRGVTLTEEEFEVMTRQLRTRMCS